MRIEQSISVEASREEVWELIKDPAEYAALLDWVTIDDAGPRVPRAPDSAEE